MGVSLVHRARTRPLARTARGQLSGRKIKLPVETGGGGGGVVPTGGMIVFVVVEGLVGVATRGVVALDFGAEAAAL